MLTFIYFFINTYNIFLLLLSIDNISYAYNFLVNNYKKKLSYKEIVDINNKTYLTPFFERYLLYGFVSIIYYILVILIIRDYIIFVKIFISLCAFPVVNNYIYLSYNNYFEFIRLKKNEITKLIFCEQIYTIIKRLNAQYVDNEIIINKEEIIQILMDTMIVKDEIITFTKNILIVLLLNYFKTKSTIYYKITKYIYMINSGKKFINNINEKNAKTIFIDIFKNKNYDKFNDPMIIHSMLFLYYNKKSSVDWDLYRQKIDYKIIEFVTLWTIGSFFVDLYRLFIIIISAIIISVTRSYSLKSIKCYYIRYYDILLLICSYLLSSNIILLSFVYNFGVYFIDNFIFRGIQKMFYEKVLIHIKNNYKQYLINIHSNYQFYIKNIMIGIIAKYLYIYNYHIPLNLFTLFITNCNSNYLEKMLYGLLYIAIINKKHIYKILLLSYIGSILIRLTRIKKVDINNNLNVNLDANANINVNEKINKNTIEEELKDAMMS